ncbi:MAG: tetratricopeptide repeat protein [Pirellulales bacterium]|nr:tetratricopeptide repeat protein [Pirellulales bacterium]
MPLYRILSFLVLTPTVLAQDTVHLRPDRPGVGSYVVRGEILDETGCELTILMQGSAKPRRYPAERIDHIETTWPKALEQGHQAAAECDFSAAALHFLAAAQVETRPWARRRIWAEWIVCYRAIGQDSKAGDLFLEMVQSDPTTPAFDRIPLAWFATESVGVAKAKTWLASQDQPAAALLGASHLLATAQRDAARARLRQLADQTDDPRIAVLAEAQLWRLEVMTSDEAKVARWGERIEAMPAVLRGGPYFILASALERLNHPDEAALAYLRVVIHCGHDRPLAARSLLGAARAIQKTGHTDQSCHLLRELVRDYPNTPEQVEAQRMLHAPGMGPVAEDS